MYSPIAAEAMARVLQAERRAQADATRLARLARLARRAGRRYEAESAPLDRSFPVSPATRGH